MPRVERLRVYPVKGLDGTGVESSRITPSGTLAWDREYAFFDPDDEWVNGKRTDRVHDCSTAFDPEAHVLTVETASETRRFDLRNDRGAAAAWFSEFFETTVEIRRRDGGGFVDRPSAGPSVISTATLETVASWFDDCTVDGVRRRLRANVEIGGVPAFWEDRLLGDSAPDVVAGDVRITGVEPCGRCVVPERDPDTGERDPDFRERFVERRRQSLPEWADEDAFDHFYAVMVIADVPEVHRGGSLERGDEVRVVDPAEPAADRGHRGDPR